MGSRSPAPSAGDLEAPLLPPTTVLEPSGWRHAKWPRIPAWPMWGQRPPRFLSRHGDGEGGERAAGQPRRGVEHDPDIQWGGAGAVCALPPCGPSAAEFLGRWEAAGHYRCFLRTCEEAFTGPQWEGRSGGAVEFSLSEQGRTSVWRPAMKAGTLPRCCAAAPTNGCARAGSAGPSQAFSWKTLSVPSLWSGTAGGRSGSSRRVTTFKGTGCSLQGPPTCLRRAKLSPQWKRGWGDGCYL